jgi:NAD(P)-dependent dehydrogenase (short-subunit alcohol dehydrogenase family)
MPLGGTPATLATAGAAQGTEKQRGWNLELAAEAAAAGAPGPVGVALDLTGDVRTSLLAQGDTLLTAGAARHRRGLIAAHRRGREGGASTQDQSDEPHPQHLLHVVSLLVARASWRERFTEEPPRDWIYSEAWLSLNKGKSLCFDGAIQPAGQRTSCGYDKLYTSEADWERGIARTLEEFGGLEIVVNNAGIEISGLVVDLNPSDLRRMLDVNVVGVALGLKHVNPAPTPGGPARLCNPVAILPFPR